jgi:O-antigen/teichoic acid export membrane protein
MSGVIGVTLAAVGFGVWSLVVQQISSTFFRTIFLWLTNVWRPALIFSFKSLREMFGFGSRLLASELLEKIFNNIYLLVIGKLFSATDLGFFTRAQTLQELPSQTLSAMVGRVAPCLSIGMFGTIEKEKALPWSW